MLAMRLDSTSVAIGYLKNLKAMWIYKLTCVLNKKIYVGKAVDLEERLYAHSRAKDKTPIHYAIRKHGWDNFTVETLEWGIESDEKLSERECYWIATLRSMDRVVGYNLTAGGKGGMLGYKFTAEQRRKLSESRRGRPASAAQRMAASRRFKGVPKSAEHRSKIAASKMGSKLPEDVLEKLRKPKTEEHRENLRRSFYRRNGTRLIEHNGETHPIAEWARRFGISGALLKYRLDHGWNVEYALTKPAVGRWA